MLVNASIVAKPLPIQRDSQLPTTRNALGREDRSQTTVRFMVEDCGPEEWPDEIPEYSSKGGGVVDRTDLSTASIALE